MQYAHGISAEHIARELRAKRDGRGWMARCPAHDDRNPSFSIRQADDRVLVHCFAGCSQEALLAALVARNLWSPTDKYLRRSSSRVSRTEAKSPTSPAIDVDDDKRGRIDGARRFWKETAPLAGTLGERYFIEHRGLAIGALVRQLPHLRWHPRARAVVALMTDAVSGEPVGVHRTFLNPDGVKIERKMLGIQGIVRLSVDDAVTTSLGLTEGIEDGFAVLLSGWSPVWVATSAGAIARFPILGGIESLTVFADADAAGLQSAESCRDRWRLAGREAVIAAPGRVG
jgi:putative DNA primase/helicase